MYNFFPLRPNIFILYGLKGYIFFFSLLPYFAFYRGRLWPPRILKKYGRNGRKIARVREKSRTNEPNIYHSSDVRFATIIAF